MTYTSHGHHIPNSTHTGNLPASVARCGGPHMCRVCVTEVAQYSEPTVIPPEYHYDENLLIQAWKMLESFDFADREMGLQYSAIVDLIANCYEIDYESALTKIMAVGSKKVHDVEIQFGPDNSYWSSTPEYNQMFIRQVEAMLKRALSSRGHVLLNDVYDELGFPRTPEGCVKGWHINFSSDLNFEISDDARYGNSITIRMTTDGDIHELL